MIYGRDWLNADTAKYIQDLALRQLVSIAVYKSWIAVCRTSNSFQSKFQLWRYGACTGGNLRVFGKIRCISRGRILIGRNVTINSGPLLNLVGSDRRTNIWVGPSAILEIGDGVGISNSTIIARVAIRIHHGTLIGGGCDIYDNDFHEILPEDRVAKKRNIGMAPVEIGPRAFIGGHTIILKGVTIGEGALVGAGSLVARDVPPYEIWAGRPARFC